MKSIDFKVMFLAYHNQLLYIDLNTYHLCESNLFNNYNNK